jgi:hypothetical protein
LKIVFDFLLAFFRNFATIAHHFVNIYVLLLAENDVEAQYPLGGVTGSWNEQKYGGQLITSVKCFIVTLRLTFIVSLKLRWWYYNS